MDLHAWFEVHLDGPTGPCWYAFDARHNRPRIGRIVMAYGRDATDCSITTIFGPAPLAGFTVITDEVGDVA
jgi:transglutaminase-like putative cysteine protease